MPLGVEYGAVFVLEGPDGTRAVFNDPSDEDFVGMLSAESSGLDSAEVREDLRERANADGATAGDFFYGPRPVILQGTVLSSSGGAPSKAERAEKIARIKRASNAMRADGTLTWSDAGLGGDETFLKVRRQQPVRFSKGYVKDFMVPLVAPYPYIRGTDSEDIVEIYSAQKSVKKFPGTQTNVTMGAGFGLHDENQWSPATSGIEADDGSYTTVEPLEDPTNQIYLVGSNYDFGIPGTATILGVRAGVKLRGSNPSSVKDFELRLIQYNGSFGELVGANKAVPTNWPTTATTRIYGGPDDLWEAALTPAGLNATGANEAGIALVPERGLGWFAGRKAEVDSIYLEVFYEEATKPQTFATVTNNGDSLATAIITIDGGASGISDPRIENMSTGEEIVLEGDIEPGEVVTIDTYNGTASSSINGNVYHMVNFTETDWFGIAPGEHEIGITADNSDGTAEMKVSCHDTYV